MFKKIFSIRTGLIVMFTLLLGSYAVLAVIVANNIYEASKPSPTSSIDVIEYRTNSDGSTIKVPKVIVAGEPFIYEITGKKLVQNGAEVRLQINCLVDGYDTPYSLGTFYSDLPAGDFSLKRNTTVSASSIIEPSDNCTLTSIATYTFYRVDKNNNETSFSVVEVGTSNRFTLQVPTTPATQPN